MAYTGDKVGKAIETAKAAEARGNAAEAVEAWKRASELIQLFSLEALSEDSRLRRIAKAREYAERAVKLRKGMKPDGGKDTSAPAGKTDADVSVSETPANEYRRLVRGLQMKSAVTWDDIGGLDAIRGELESFFGIFLAAKPDGVVLDTFRNIMFYGPPGTGKTMIAAAVSNQLEASFFNVKSSDLTSKYFGESSKLVNALYEEARSEADTGLSVVFIDEFDALCRARDSSTSGAEQRILSTILSELDGLAEKGEDKGVLTIAATNRPDALDQAIRSRFQRQFYIPLPDKTARGEIIAKLLRNSGLSEFRDIDWLAEKTEGFSGRNIQGVVRGAVSRMIAKSNPDIRDLVRKGKDAIQSYTLKTGEITRADFEDELKNVRVDPDEVARSAAYYAKYRG